MNKFLVQRQSQAEKDPFLIDCFHDAGFLKDLIEIDYSILAGRKGNGKTAIARYLEKKYESHDLLLAKRITISSFSGDESKVGSQEVRESILLFILLQTAKALFEKNYLIESSGEYWEQVFKDTSLTGAVDYEAFKTISRKNSVGISALISGKLEEERLEADISITSDSIFNAIHQSMDCIGEQTSFLFFVDDLSDYLDNLNKELLKEDIGIIKEILIRLDTFNTKFKDSERGLRFVSCIREDLFDFMEGSNINKLRTNSLFLHWNEESFAGLVIRRLPYFEENREEALKNPYESIKSLFPDEIFSKKLKTFETNRYATNFYAYLVAVSFNRPRDFLYFCYALRNRLSFKRKVVIENIDGAEIEYSDYFKNEIKDELFLAGKIFDINPDDNLIEELVDIMAERDSFNFNQLRTEIAQLFKTKTTTGKNKIEEYIYQMWCYGTIGFKEENDQIVNYRYILSSKELIRKNVKKYVYYLHRGLWWFAQKRKEKRSENKR